VTSRQYRLGIAKLKNVFRSFLTHNGYSYRLDFFTDQCHFVRRCAFSPTAAAPVLASWFYQSLPLFSFVLHSFLPYRIGDNLRYVHYGKCSTCIMASAVRALWQVQYKPGGFLHHSLLGMVAKRLMKQSIMKHRIKVTHPLLYQ